MHSNRSAVRLRIVVVLSTAMLALGSMPEPLLSPVQAQQVKSPVGPEFDIVSATTVDKIVGMNGNTVSWKDGFRGVVLRIKGRIPEDTTLYAADFLLSYSRADVPSDRSRCTAISAPSSGVDDEVTWLVGDYVKTPARSGVRYFSLGCGGLEAEVASVSLNYSRYAAGPVKVPSK